MDGILSAEFPVEGSLKNSKRRLGMNWGAGDSAVFFIAGPTDSSKVFTSHHLMSIISCP